MMMDRTDYTNIFGHMKLSREKKNYLKEIYNKISVSDVHIEPNAIQMPKNAGTPEEWKLYRCEESRILRDQKKINQLVIEVKLDAILHTVLEVNLESKKEKDIVLVYKKQKGGSETVFVNDKKILVSDYILFLQEIMPVKNVPDFILRQGVFKDAVKHQPYQLADALRAASEIHMKIGDRLEDFVGKIILENKAQVLHAIIDYKDEEEYSPDHLWDSAMSAIVKGIKSSDFTRIYHQKELMSKLALPEQKHKKDMFISAVARYYDIQEAKKYMYQLYAYHKGRVSAWRRRSPTLGEKIQVRFDAALSRKKRKIKRFSLSLRNKIGFYSHQRTN